MNVLFINTLYDGGGAENIARELFKNMGKKANVYFLGGFNTKPIEEDNVFLIYPNLFFRVINRVLTKNHSHKSKTILLSKMALKRLIKKYDIDLVHIHNAHGNYLGINDIKYLLDTVPVVWAIHDCWIMTGHCASPADCDGWKTGCKNCEHLDYYPPFKNKRDVKDFFNLKKDSFTKKGVNFVVPSTWIKNQVSENMLLGESISVIGNGIDIDKFVPLDKKEIRNKYNIPNDKNVIGIISAHLNIPQKGIGLLVDAINGIDDIDNYHLVIAGGDEDFLKGKIKCPCTYLGYLNDESNLSEFYSSLDLLINPSLVEAFGLINIEAMSCGTPALTFDIGPMREIIDEKVGWIADDPTPESLRRTIERIFSNREELSKKSSNAREYVDKNYSISSMTDKYYDLYKKVLGN